MPTEGSYLSPKSMCSCTPKPKFPVLEKHLSGSSNSFTCRPLVRISSAFSPRTVTWQAIFSLRRIPNVLNNNKKDERTNQTQRVRQTTYEHRGMTGYDKKCDPERFVQSPKHEACMAVELQPTVLPLCRKCKARTSS